MTADQALLNMMYAMRGGLSGVLKCALSEECRDLKALIGKLGSRGANLITWTAEELQGAFFSTYPHQPTPVDPGLLVLSIGLSNTPVIGDLYDLYTGVTGYDPITGQYLAGWERLANIVGALPIFGTSGANIRHGEHAFESLVDHGRRTYKTSETNPASHTTRWLYDYRLGVSTRQTDTTSSAVERRCTDRV